MTSFKVQLLLWSIFVVAVYSDKSIQYGFVVGNKSPYCKTEKFIAPFANKVPSFDYSCKVRPDTYIAAVKVIFKGHPSSLGGAFISEGGIKYKNVTVHVWGEAYRHLDAGVYVYVNWTEPTTTALDKYYG